MQQLEIRDLSEAEKKSIMLAKINRGCRNKVVILKTNSLQSFPDGTIKERILKLLKNNPKKNFSIRQISDGVYCSESLVKKVLLELYRENFSIQTAKNEKAVEYYYVGEKA